MSCAWELLHELWNLGIMPLQRKVELSQIADMLIHCLILHFCVAHTSMQVCVPCTTEDKPLGLPVANILHYLWQKGMATTSKGAMMALPLSAVTGEVRRKTSWGSFTRIVACAIDPSTNSHFAFECKHRRLVLRFLINGLWYNNHRDYCIILIKFELMPSSWIKDRRVLCTPLKAVETRNQKI